MNLCTTHYFRQPNHGAVIDRMVGAVTAVVEQIYSGAIG